MTDRFLTFLLSPAFPMRFFEHDDSRSLLSPARVAVRAAVCLMMLLTLLVVAREARAQGAQKYGAQLSVLSTAIIYGNNTTSSGGVGLEPQFRLNRVFRSPTAGVVSLGIGGQWTTHSSGPDEITITGAFLEPRWVPPVSFERVFPYIAGRIALLQQSNNFGTSSSGSAFGAGGGIAFVVTSRLNIDAGVAIVRQSFGDFEFTRQGLSGTGEFKPFTTYAAKLGFSLGFPQ